MAMSMATRRATRATRATRGTLAAPWQPWLPRRGLSSGPITVRFGDVESTRTAPKRPALVPTGYCVEGAAEQDPLMTAPKLAHLRWMLQKDILGQDMFLLGSPGPARRRLALEFAQRTQREVEFVAISRDTTEADLKQRREIAGGTAEFVDQAPVRAALEGRLLVVDGIEKAERNVLPTLNNLLENREMQLDDGRFITSAERYAELEREGALPPDGRLVPAHPDFRVLALGLPVPPFKGKPLDPPLRSRFQVRVVEPESPGEAWQSLLAAMSSVGEVADPSPAANPRLMALIGAVGALRDMEQSWRGASEHHVVGLPHLPESSMAPLAVLQHALPEEPLAGLLCRAYPFFGSAPLSRDQAVFRNTCAMLLEQRAEELGAPGPTRYLLRSIAVDDAAESCSARFHFLSTRGGADGHRAELVGAVGPGLAKGEHEAPLATLGGGGGRAFHSIDKHQALLSGMVQDHCAGRDLLLLGHAGSGKSRLVEQFGRALGYQTQLFSLYRDMSARDLLQRRTTDNSGNTGWEHSPLVRAAVNGDLLILDGVDRVDPETLTVVQRLIQDREADLFDGTRLRAQPPRGEPEQEGELHVHPAFRVVALASLGRSKSDSAWLTSELLSMFSAHHLEQLQPAEQELVMRACHPGVPGEFLSTLREFSAALCREQGARGKEGVTRAASLGIEPLSTRQVMRLARFADAFPERAVPELRERLRNILLGHFLPASQRRALEQLMDEVGVAEDAPAAEEEDVSIETDGKVLRIGKVETSVEVPEHPELVPAPLFYDIRKHKLALRDILEDVVCQEKYILLIGNQGVGKNKLADRLLQLLRKEREYIQLHRDSTVGSLTLSPSLRNGIVVWEDSPLVRAAVHGRVLMVDEIDKAPLEVVSVLKSLIEDEEMLLADGRRLVSRARFEATPPEEAAKRQLVPIHDGFMILALANRPGWPFQGNSFFQEIGDIFSSHVISNPDLESELQLVQAYAPNVDPQVLRKLAMSFADLRKLVEDGTLVYPYSARECVAVARHLEAFPNDGLVQTLENVLGFDSFDPQLLDVIVGVFQRHGVPLTSSRRGSAGAPTIALADTEKVPPAVFTEAWTSSSKRKQK